jgi:hypothetical protein
LILTFNKIDKKYIYTLINYNNYINSNKNNKSKN